MYWCSAFTSPLMAHIFNIGAMNFDAIIKTMARFQKMTSIDAIRWIDSLNCIACFTYVLVPFSIALKLRPGAWTCAHGKHTNCLTIGHAGKISSYSMIYLFISKIYDVIIAFASGWKTIMWYKIIMYSMTMISLLNAEYQN